MSTPLFQTLKEKAADRPLVIAHRGFSESHPENTLPAFTAAIEAGVDAIEFDIRATRKGELVCSHDEDLWRCINFAANPEAKGLRVYELSASEIQKIDFGGWKGPRFTGVTAPTLEEALREMNNRVTPVIERKSGSPEQVVSALRALKQIDKVVLSSFDWDFLRQARELEPSLTINAIGGGPFYSKHLRELSPEIADIVSWQYYGLTREDLQELREAGYTVWSWTVNHEFELRDCIALGLKGIVSDRPHVLLRILSES